MAPSLAAENKALFSKCPGVEIRSSGMDRGRQGWGELSCLFSRSPRAQMAKEPGRDHSGEDRQTLSLVATASSPPLMMVNSDFPDLHIPQRPEVWKLEGDKSPGRMRGGQGDRVLQK